MSVRASAAVSRASSAALILAAAAWGLGTVLTKAALAYVPPLALLVIQLAASLAVLGLLLLFQRPSFKPYAPKRLLAAGGLGLLNPGLAYTLSLIGLARTTASMSALLWALEPLLIVGAAALLLRERPGLRFVLLSAAAAGGVVLAAGARLGQPGQMVGNALILAGVACCALYSVLARRAGAGLSPLLIVTLQQGVALGWALLLWPAGWTTQGLGELVSMPLGAWALAAVSGVLYYGLAFWCYLSGLRHVSASQAGAFINLVPVFALGGALALLGEALAPVQWLGASLVLAAVVGLRLKE